jgi:acetylornithine/N-succinyldiaminopimelate aminotransferase
MNTFELDKKYVAPTYARFPIEIVGGKGSIAYGADGKEYIDMGSGIGVNSFGFCDSEWIAAVTKQLNAFQHTSNLYYSNPCARLAELLCQKTGLKKVFFSNSGAEANECAIKAARKYGAEKRGSGCHTIITLKNSFHGRTLTTLAATGQEAFHEHFLPLTEGFIHCEPNAEELRNAIEENNVCAIMFEVIRGEGGVLPLDSDFVKAMADIAAQKDILLIADEVQTGNGRTGKLYGYMNYGIRPDIVTTAKGIGGGLPIGVTMLGEKVEGVFTPGLNGSTFGGNPVCCAGAISILERLDDGFMAEVEKKSEYIFSELEGAKGVESLSGIGLMIGIKAEKPAKQAAAECLEKGVLVLTAKDKIRLLPALNIPFEELKKAVQVIKEVCARNDI